MKKIVTIITTLICQIAFAQITQEDISKLKDLPENYQYQLDILEQKQVDGVFKTTKHKRFEVDIFEFNIDRQKIYDTINNSHNENREIEYRQYVNNWQLTYTDFEDKIIKIEDYDYSNENQLYFKTTLDENEEETIKETYTYGKCKANYIADLLDDTNTENPNDTFHCETITTHKKISNYKTTVVKVFKIGTGKVKEIDLKGDKNSEISRFYTYEYDENGQPIKVNLHRKDKVSVYKTYKYNKQGDVIFMKSGYVAFNYTYKYDKHNNWIEKIETSKVKNKRRVFKRTFIF